MAEKTVTVKALRQPPANAPPETDLFIAACLQALKEGTASAHQQQRALEWIVRHASMVHAPAYYDTDRESTFMLGRQFTGQFIIGLLNLNLLNFSEPLTKEP